MTRKQIARRILNDLKSLDYHNVNVALTGIGDTSLISLFNAIKKEAK